MKVDSQHNTIFETFEVFFILKSWIKTYLIILSNDFSYVYFCYFFIQTAALRKKYPWRQNFYCLIPGS